MGSFLSPSKDAKKQDRKNPRNLTVPDKVTEYSLFYVFLMDGKKLRTEEESFLLNGRSEVVQYKSRFAFDGTTQRQLSDPARNPYPEANVASGMKPGGINTPYTPLAMATRPFDSVINYFSDFTTRFRVSPGESMVNSRTCLYLNDVGPSDFVNHIWVDASRGFVPIKFIRAFKGKNLLQYDFLDYEENAGIWTPKSWRSTAIDPDGGILNSSNAVVKLFSVNPEAASDNFYISFPVGTWVHDEDDDSEYILLENGVRRILTPRDLVNNSYDSLVTHTVWWKSAWFWLASSCILTGAFVCAWNLRRRFFTALGKEKT
jgi:hypothetical protein